MNSVGPSLNALLVDAVCRLFYKLSVMLVEIPEHARCMLSCNTL